MLWPMIALSNIAQGSAVLAMAVLQRKNAEAQEVNVPSCISCYLGVTEPAIFGVNLKHVYPFVCGMIGSACAAVVCVATGTTANAIGVGGLPGILSIQTEYMGSFAICMVISVSVSFALTVLVGRRKLPKPAPAEKKGTEDYTEQAVKRSDGKKEENEAKQGSGDGNEAEQGSGDGNEAEQGSGEGKSVFSEGIMGEGMAIIPENNLLYAPADALVSVLMQDSRHACGLTLENGMELLLHVGIDTVDMNGDGFRYLVSEGQKVAAGTPLLEFDRDKIKAAGHRDVTVCIVTEPAGAENLRFMTGIKGEAGITSVAVFE